MYENPFKALSKIRVEVTQLYFVGYDNILFILPFTVSTMSFQLRKSYQPSWSDQVNSLLKISIFNFYSLKTTSWLRTLGAIHSTKISGSNFENFLGANGSRRVRKVSSIPLSKRVSRSFKKRMLDSFEIAVARVRVTWQIRLYQ